MISRFCLSGRFIFLPIIYFIILASCASLKIVERSAKERPVWIDGPEQNFLTGVGVGNSYDEAKMIALQIVKEKIVSAVAQNISLVSGKIHYSSDLTRESKVCEILNVNYTTNW